MQIALAIVGGKTRVYEVGSAHRQWMDSEDWIIRGNMHEAIISKEDFAEVQNRLSSNTKHIGRERKHFHILQDKVYCGKCHHKMSYTVYYGKNDGYYCPYRYKAKDCGCIKGKIQAPVLEEIVSKEIQLYTERFLEKEQTRITSQKVRESICESLLERKKKLEAEQQKNQISKMQCYERHKQGIMEKDEYLAKREFLIQRAKNIEQEISFIEDKIQENTASRHHLNVDKAKRSGSKRRNLF